MMSSAHAHYFSWFSTWSQYLYESRDEVQNISMPPCIQELVLDDKVRVGSRFVLENLSDTQQQWVHQVDGIIALGSHYKDIWHSYLGPLYIGPIFDASSLILALQCHPTASNFLCTPHHIDVSCQTASIFDSTLETLEAVPLTNYYAPNCYEDDISSSSSGETQLPHGFSAYDHPPANDTMEYEILPEKREELPLALVRCSRAAFSNPHTSDWKLFIVRKRLAAAVLLSASSVGSLLSSDSAQSARVESLFSAYVETAMSRIPGLYNISNIIINIRFVYNEDKVKIISIEPWTSGNPAPFDDFSEIENIGSDFPPLVLPSEMSSPYDCLFKR